MSFLITRLWDKHLPLWREIKAAADQKPNDPEESAKIVAEINRIGKEAQVRSGERLSADETQFMHIARSVLRRKGKWVRYPDDLR